MKNFKVFSLFASLFLIFGMATTGCSQTNPDSATSNIDNKTNALPSQTNPDSATSNIDNKTNALPSQTNPDSATSNIDNKTNALPITITWKNYDGSILEVDNNVPYGSMPTFDGEIPTREDDNQYTYTFDGWSPQITKAVEPRTYIAQFTSVKKQFTFVSYGDGYALTNYSGTDTVVTIPDEYNGRPVVAIGTYGTGFSSGRPDGFYYNGSIEKVVLPSSLRTINQYAFSNCIALTEVDDSKIEDRFDIMAYSFSNTPSLQEFIIRGSVYNNAFYSSGIKKITIDRNITSVTGTETVYVCNSCNNLNEIVFTGNNYIFQSNMYIAYNCNNLTKVTFTDANCELEGPVLNGMYNLKEVTLPTLTCPIWELFGKTEYKSSQLELLSGKVELPNVSNCEITEKEKHRFDMGYTIVYLYSPKSWAINDFWFYDGDCWWFLASNNYQFYYSMYEYTLNDLWVMIKWPSSVSSDDFIRMPKDLKIISLDSNLKADSEYLLNTGYEVVYQ